MSFVFKENAYMEFDDFVDGVMDLMLDDSNVETYDEQYGDGNAHIIFAEDVDAVDVPSMSEIKSSVDERWQSWESEAFNDWMMHHGDAAEEDWKEGHPGQDGSDGLMINDIYEWWSENESGEEWSNFDKDLHIILFTSFDFKFYNGHWCSVEAEMHYEHRYSNNEFDSEKTVADFYLDMVNGQNLKEMVLKKFGGYIAGEIPENRTPVIPGLEDYFKNASSLTGPVGIAVRVAIDKFKIEKLF